MGYRTYIQVVKKDIVLDLHNCKTINDLLKVQEKHGIKGFNPESNWGGAYFNAYSIPYRDRFEFGKDCYDGRGAYDSTQPIFTTPELQKLVEESDFRFGGIEVLKVTIDWTEKFMVNMYQNLVDCKSDWEPEQNRIDRMSPEEKKEYHYKLLLNHCDNYLHWWKPFGDYNAYNKDRENPTLAGDWLYEHEFWDLVRMWKEFDEENELVVFLGW